MHPRYARHYALSEMGEAGQELLSQSRVLIVGLGGLGCPAATYLTAAGVGTLGLMDGDRVELSNLQRQTLYQEDQIGRLKVEAAQRVLSAQNSEVQFELYPKHFCVENAPLVGEYDLVVDATDNWTARYLINDACYLFKKSDVFGSVLRFEGQVTVFQPGKGCYRCLFPEPGPVPNCAEAGVLGAMAGLIGTLQAMEAIKSLVSFGSSLSGTLLTWDARTMRSRRVEYISDPNCPLCGRKTLTQIQEIPLGEGGEDCSPKWLYTKRDEVLLLDVREADERAQGSIGGMWIPLGELEKRVAEIASEAPVVVYCQRGGRGRRAVDILKSAGRDRVYNLAGGLERWAREFGPL